MAYYADLSADSLGKSIYIGWLDREHDFSQGAINPDFLEKLKIHYSFRVRQTRGFHVCHFCDECRFGIPVEICGKTLTLGSAEIDIFSLNGRIYVVPDLLYHYIAEHGYLPPSEFVEAVLLGAGGAPLSRP